MNLSLIAAMALNRVIGQNNQLPWHLSEDLKNFKKLTTGNTVLMGRKTYESIGRPLPHRRNIVLSRKKEFCAEGVTIYRSFEHAMENLDPTEEVFVIGGEQIYKEAFSRAKKIYLTLVHRDFDGDVKFPSIPKNEFEEISRKRFEGPLPYSFIIYKRVG